MSRSIRRFQAARMKTRYVRRAFEHSPEWFFGAWPYRRPGRWWAHGVNYYPFSHTPSWWIREMMAVKARAQEKTLRHRVLRGDDAEGLAWPLARKPHVYYW